MQKIRSHRLARTLAGIVLTIIALATAGCASSKPQGAPSLAEEWQQLRQGLRDGTPLSSRGQEVSRSLDSHFPDRR